MKRDGRAPPAAGAGISRRSAVPRRRSRAAGGALRPLLLGLLASGAAPLLAQEPEPPPLPAADSVARQEAAPPDTAGGEGVAPEDRPRRAGCPLVLEPKATTNLERIQRGGGFVYYVGGGMLWRCGNAEMEADSAIRYEAARRVEMMGDVRYRDTIRTLSSDFLTYYELPDLVVATGDVRLRRTSSGSTLEGPRVEFLRAVSGLEEVTTATGRPHLTLRPRGGGESPPFEVDADVAVLAGEERARARGDVVIRRPDLLARADSAAFDIAAGGGVLHGSPEVEGRGFRLSGDTIRLRFEGEDLREVWARGRGYAAGEAFEVMSAEIRALIEEEKAREVWAYGPERSLAISPPYHVYGDSLRFALTAGRIDTVVAVGEAVAVEEPEEGETLASADGAGPAVRPAGAAAATTREVPAPDTSAAVDDSARAPTGPRAAADTVEAAASDTAAVRRVGRSRPDRLPEPRLGVDRTTSWMAGDTLFAVFAPVAPDSATGVDAEAPTEDEPPREEAERRLERIRVTSVEGTARAYYSAVTDSARTRVPSRNYIIGREIDILFEGDEVAEVRGERAIGVYLDPREDAPLPGEPLPGPGEAPPDTAADSDTTAVADTTAGGDTMTLRDAGGAGALLVPGGRAATADGGRHARKERGAA